MTFVKETSPYLRKPISVNRMLIDVLIALLPVTVFAFVVFRLDALKNILISFATMELIEFIFVLIISRKSLDVTKLTFKESLLYRIKKYKLSNFLSALISSLIFALIMPASASWYTLVIGALIGILIGKLVFGGLGNNIFNPAAVGLVVSKICFPNSFNYSSNWFFDVSTGGTALTAVKEGGYSFINSYSLLDLFLGKCPGAIGEISAVCILIGAIYLFIRRSADIRIFLSYVFSFSLIMLFAGICISSKKSDVNAFQFLGYQILSGGMLFGATFMLTDPVTSPITRPGRILYGIIAASLTCLIRLFGAYAEGVAFSILLSNMVVPCIDYYKWSSNKYSWKNILWMASILVVVILIIVLVLLFGGVVK